MNVKLKAPGPTGFGTTLINGDTGEEIDGVVSVTARMQPDEYNTLEVVLASGEIEIEGRAVFQVCDPRDGQPKQVRTIQFVDDEDWAAE